MSSFTKLTYHVVFGTKYRRPLIMPEFQARLSQYISGIIREKSGHLIEIGGIADHVHILAHFPPTISVSAMIGELKGSSSTWMNTEKLADRHFEWQKGYGAFTVSYSQVEVVQNYIQQQESHHKKTSFEDEYRAMLIRHNIQFDPRYLFEAENHG